MSWYCYRCDRGFRSRDAIDQHIRDSREHYICPTCGEDEASFEELMDHRRHDHKYCNLCGRDLEGEISYYETVRDHELESHYMCGMCDRIFSSESNLRNHQRTHAERNVACYGEDSGCHRMFDCVSAMMLHLEGGRCPSNMDLVQVDKLAAQCYQHRQYTNNADERHKYRCPTCCDNFSKMSALLQHAESFACEEDIDDWPLCKVLHYICQKT